MSFRFSSSENHSAIPSARPGPMPSTSWISSWVASMSLSIEPKCAARFRAVTQPVSGMFRPARTRWNVIVFFDCSIAATALPAEISA